MRTRAPSETGDRLDAVDAQSKSLRRHRPRPHGSVHRRPPGQPPSAERPGARGWSAWPFLDRHRDGCAGAHKVGTKELLTQRPTAAARPMSTHGMRHLQLERLTGQCFLEIRLPESDIRMQRCLSERRSHLPSWSRHPGPPLGRRRILARSRQGWQGAAERRHGRARDTGSRGSVQFETVGAECARGTTSAAYISSADRAAPLPLTRQPATLERDAPRRGAACAGRRGG
jgi:hypothetical protein